MILLFNRKLPKHINCKIKYVLKISSSYFSFSEFPEWIVHNLEGGVGVSLRVLAANPRGRSHAVRLELHVPAMPMPAAGMCSKVDP